MFMGNAFNGNRLIDKFQIIWLTKSSAIQKCLPRQLNYETIYIDAPLPFPMLHNLDGGVFSVARNQHLGNRNVIYTDLYTSIDSCFDMCYGRQKLACKSHLLDRKRSANT